MYVYVYDELLEDRRYERELALIETRLTDLGIMGKICRLALFRDATHVIREEVRLGANTVVAVGNDATLRKIIDALAGSPKVVAALIPIGPQGQMADILGIPPLVMACDVLSARNVEAVDVGEVNGKRFVHAASFEADDALIRVDDSFTVSLKKSGKLEVRNLAAPDDAGVVSPVDGKLSLIIRQSKFSLLSRKADVSVIPFDHAFVTSKTPTTLSVDGETMQGMHFEFRTIPGVLRIVVGKERKF